MKLLTIDTSTSSCSVALSIDDRLAATYLQDMERTLTSRLMASIDLILRGAGLAVTDLDAFGVALGPGSFTGVRVGVATVKGLALASGKPVVGFSSLAMLAMNIPLSSMPVCPMFDARKKEVYVGLYDCAGFPSPLISDRVVAPTEFLTAIKVPTIFVGEGALRYRELITGTLGDKAIYPPWNCHQPQASAGSLLAARAAAKGCFIPHAALDPYYIRPSEAELARKKSS
jgi:tRNA threonylcarbamoyladenosine biosynthesis protein TsaB